MVNLTPNFKRLFSFKKREVELAYAQSQLHRSRYGIRLLMTSVPSELSGLNHGKLLIVTPRKTGPAPKRNLLRRRLKAIYYQEKLYNVKALGVIILYDHATTLSFNELRKFLIEGILSYKEKLCAKK